METIRINADVPMRAHYIRRVLDCGHVPGVLSGALLQGKARRYGASYARSRARAAAIAAQVGVMSALVPVDVGTQSKPMRRLCRVWVRNGKPVCLTLD